MKLQKNIPLARYSNYEIGGPAAFLARAKNVGDVRKAIEEARRRSLPIFILGGGTNLLIPDEGFKGLVLMPDIRILERKGNSIIAGAGVSVADLLRFASREELSGLEWAGGLPGTVGGAIRGNAGAFKGEIKDNIVSVTSFDIKTGKVLKRNQAKCRFGYRMSVFKEKEGREVILEAVFRMKPGDLKAIRSATREKIAYRKAKHPMEHPNIGSIFKNVPVADVPKKRRAELAYSPKLDPFPVVPAARLIGKAGLTGFRRGKAMVSPKHTNFIVNLGGAKERDVAWLMDHVKAAIKKRFGVELHEEVERLRDKIARLKQVTK